MPATPWTSTQKAQIRWYLGWSARFHQFDSRLEQAMSAIEGEEDDATHDLIVACLADLADIDTRLTDSYKRIKARAVGSITLPSGDEMALLKGEGRRFVGQLAATLGVEVRHDVFGSGRFRSFASFGGLEPGGGNYFRQG